MIYTSYYARAKKIPEDVIRVAISRVVPNWFEGLKSKIFAPPLDLILKYKQDHDEEHYKQVYNAKLVVLSPIILGDLLEKKFPNRDIVLLCYERPDQFCHRHLVREWLNRAGVECREWGE